jgi:FkbM family methyltransferase
MRFRKHSRTEIAAALYEVVQKCGWIRRPPLLLKETLQPTSVGKSLALGGHYNLELHLGHVIRAYNIDTVIDAGANEGQFGASMRKLGFRGDIHSFEPVKATYEILAQAAAGDDRWKATNIALGRKAGQARINVSEASDLSSFLDCNEFGMTRFKGIRASRKETVAVHRLDEFIKPAEMKGKRVLLKIDTQGYDALVFEGARGLLPNICAMISELSLIPIYHGMKHYLEMLDMYQNSGFSVSGIYPVSRNKQDLSLIEIDCVLVNPKLY